MDATPIPPRPRYWLHALLFVTTCATTTYAGGVVFAVTLMAILVTHEMGHYVAARRHGIDVSLPYFIPFPFALGTLGALIRMRAPIRRRDALIDVGAAGPLAGLALAIPFLVVGLHGSPVNSPPAGEVSFVEGNSILYILLKLAVTGRYLPSHGQDVFLSPMAMAAWMGILLTFINLMPIGQLDGGHVAYAYFGAQHERRSRWLHRGLLACGAVVAGQLALEASVVGFPRGAALTYGLEGALPWFVWALLILGMRRITGGKYHPPTDSVPLSPSRRALFWVVAVVFVLIFTPVPMRMALSP